jgi:hypothetical protein
MTIDTTKGTWRALLPHGSVGKAHVIFDSASFPNGMFGVAHVYGASPEEIVAPRELPPVQRRALVVCTRRPLSASALGRSTGSSNSLHSTGARPGAEMTFGSSSMQIRSADSRSTSDLPLTPRTRRRRTRFVRYPEPEAGSHEPNTSHEHGRTDRRVGCRAAPGRPRHIANRRGSVDRPT